jgi:hypothetical protein
VSAPHPTPPAPLPPPPPPLRATPLHTCSTTLTPPPPTLLSARTQGVAPDPGTLSDSGAGWELIKVQHDLLDVALSVLAAAKAAVPSGAGERPTAIKRHCCCCCCCEHV